MTDRNAELEALTQKFAQDALAIILRTVQNDLSTFMGMGRKATSAPKPASDGSSIRLGRRSQEDIEGLLQSMVETLKAHPGGLRAEQIREQLKLDKREMAAPIKMGLEAAILTKTGEKRATTYSLPGTKVGGPGSGGMPKKRAAKKKA